jgi:hypothetical protein
MTAKRLKLLLILLSLMVIYLAGILYRPRLELRIGVDNLTAESLQRVQVMVVSATSRQFISWRIFLRAPGTGYLQSHSKIHTLTQCSWTRKGYRTVRLSLDTPKLGTAQQWT